MLHRRWRLAGSAGALAPVEPEEPEDPDPPDPGNPVTVTLAWSGAVTTTAAVVKARCADASSMTLKVSTSPMLTSPLTFAGTEGNDEVWTFTATGLSADTQYHYGFVGSDVTGKFRTFPSGAASFTIAAASCSGNITGSGLSSATSNADTFTYIKDREPLLFLHMGDLHYRNINSNNPSLFHTAYRDVHANPNQGELYRAVPIAYRWDDHDFGRDNASSTSVSRPAAAQAYRDYVPHYTLPDSGNIGIWQTFVIGRVRFVLLDSRSYRVTATDVHLGTEQTEWLHDTLLAADEPCIVLCFSVPWTSSSSDSWGGFEAERTALSDFLDDNDLWERVFIVHGDYHRLAYDLGSHSDFRTSGSNDGPPVVGFAPLHAATSGSSNKYVATYNTSTKMYGTLAFEDDGSEIVVTATGWAVGESSESQVFTFQRTYPG